MERNLLEKEISNVLGDNAAQRWERETAHITTPPPLQAGSKFHPDRLTSLKNNTVLSGFKQEVYIAHIFHSAKKNLPFVPDQADADIRRWPDSNDLMFKSSENGKKKYHYVDIHTRMFEPMKSLLTTARENAAREGQDVKIFLRSGYRSASVQFRSWDTNFKDYYDRAVKAGVIHKNDFSATAASRLAHFIGGKLGAPGYSKHQHGRAIDFAVLENDIWHLPDTNDMSVKAWLKTWFWRWLDKNAHTFGFEPYTAEPWHWEYWGDKRSVKVTSTGQTTISTAISSPSTPVLSTTGVQGNPSGSRMGANSLFRLAASAIGWSKVSLDERRRFVMSVLVNKYKYPPNAAAGMVGNLESESGIIPNRVEGSTLTDPMYAKGLDGTPRRFSVDEIMNRNRHRRYGPLKPGIGLAQWTYAPRRKGLFLHVYEGKQGGDILFNMNAQIDYLVKELKSDFKRLDKILSTPSINITHASDAFLSIFERPGSIIYNKKIIGRGSSGVPDQYKKKAVEIYDKRARQSQAALEAFKKAF